MQEDVHTAASRLEERRDFAERNQAALFIAIHADYAGKKARGVIRANARRIDVVTTGGRYIEPVQGTPRRIQGPIIDVDTGRNTVTIHAAAPIVCKVTDPRQRADQFKPGDFVACDLIPGSSFTPRSG